jgi:tyrosine-protein kinase Etk/Wzc
MNQEPDLIKYISILLRWKRFIVINFIIVLLLSGIVSFILPKWYKSTASLLPPKQPDIFNSLSASSSILKGIGGLGKLGGLGQKSSAYNYFAILHSRTTMENVVRKFDLISVYDISDSSMEKAIKELDGNVAFEEQTDDNITIEVYDKDPIRAANLANYFVEVLNEVSIRLGTQEVRSNREFIESRVSETQHGLRQSEEALREFQEHSGMILTPDQTTSADAVATLYASKAKMEVEVAIMEHNVIADNPTLIQKKLELLELNKKISTIPQIGLKSFRLFRDVAIQQKILEFLIPIYEQARIEEQKDVPVLLVLDKAVPAEKKSKPKRSLIIFLASFLALTFSILLAFLLQGIEIMEGTGNLLIQRLKFWLNKITLLYGIRKRN